MNARPQTAAPPLQETRTAGSQTLFRGLDVLEAVAGGIAELPELAAHLGLTRSTTHRLAAALVERRYLSFTPRSGYRLGPKLLELGSIAQQETDLVQIAHPFLSELSNRTSDTVHLGILDGDRALYLDKIPGRRRVEISSRVGERHPLTTTGLGKSLLLDEPQSRWHAFYAAEAAPAARKQFKQWSRRMEGYVREGRTFDLGENEIGIRCVGAPVRNASGAIVAAISLSSATQYMDDTRMAQISDDVRKTAREISKVLGWNNTKRA
jgi:DNA-binding IclR family transcriptional regulator